MFTHPFFWVNMAIGQSKLHEMIRRGNLLSEAVAWLQTFDPKTKTAVLDLIREDQLKEKGIDGDGNVIGYYSYVTSLINPEKAFNTHYTFFDTGEFFRSMFVKVLSDRIEINGDGNKGDENLFVKYGSEIIKLTDENTQILKEMVRESYIKYARSIIFNAR